MKIISNLKKLLKIWLIKMQIKERIFLILKYKVILNNLNKYNGLQLKQKLIARIKDFQESKRITKNS